MDCLRSALHVCIGLQLGLSSAGSSWAHAEDLERLESRLPFLEEQVRQACADEHTGEARASLAYLTYNRANAMTADLNRELAKVNRFLDNPEDITFKQLTDDLSKAREGSRQKFKTQLDLDVQALDWMRIQSTSGRPYPQQMIEKQREKVKQSKRLLDYYSRSEIVAETVMSPDQMRKLLSVKLGEAVKQMKQMTALGRKFDAASSRAWGCWVTATNSGKMADAALRGPVAGAN